MGGGEEICDQALRGWLILQVALYHVATSRVHGCNRCGGDHRPESHVDGGVWRVEEPNVVALDADVEGRKECSGDGGGDSLGEWTKPKMMVSPGERPWWGREMKGVWG